ncbi:MAG TPA: transporter substrate-binding domain-containing protein [Dictyobacter sp.]|nr:transporter substrate-binding domain-containing protein [Dictyobacter sp.]
MGVFVLRGRRLTWLFVFTCAVVAPLVYVSCIAAKPIIRSVKNSRGMTLSDTVTPHVLTIGSATGYFPLEYVNPTTHQLVGFDIELARAIAQQLHLGLSIEPTPFSQLISSLNANQEDMAISAIGISPELQEQVHFIPYLRSGESLLVNKGNPLHITNLADLCGHRVAVKKSTFEVNELYVVNHVCQQQQSKGITLSIVSTDQAAILLLQKGIVAAIYQDALINDYYSYHEVQFFTIGGLIIHPIVLGIAVSGNDTSTYTRLQQVLGVLEKDGIYHQLITKWGLTNGDITTPPGSHT